MNAKRTEILEHASQVFMRYGIKSVTMDDLSNALSVSKKTIYKYFEDKSELVRSIIELKLEMDRSLCRKCREEAQNAIEELINMSRLFIQNISGMNPVVFRDLEKYYPDAWQLMEYHKWQFLLSNIRNNIRRGVNEEFYRENLHAEVVSRLYVASIDVMMNGQLFEWPEFKLEEIFRHFVGFQIKGMASEKGRNYLKETFNQEMNE